MVDMSQIIFSDEDKELASNFAIEAASSNFNRRNVSSLQQQRDIRVGKLAELAFIEFLNRNGKVPSGNEDMLVVWEEQTRGDKTDFTTKESHSIDVKSATLKDHKWILVPKDQLNNAPKDYYAAVGISSDESYAEVLGYATLDDFKNAGSAPPAVARYYPAYGVELANLRPIAELLALIEDDRLPRANST